MQVGIINHMHGMVEGIYPTRLLGHFAPISYFHCEHVHFYVNCKTKINKNSRILKEISWIF